MSRQGSWATCEFCKKRLNGIYNYNNHVKTVHRKESRLKKEHDLVQDRKKVVERMRETYRLFQSLSVFLQGPDTQNLDVIRLAQTQFESIERRINIYKAPDDERDTVTIYLGDIAYYEERLARAEAELKELELELEIKNETATT